VDFLYLCTRINKKHKKMARYRKQKEESLFEEELTIWALSELGNPLEDLEKLIDFEMFRPQLEDALQNKDCKTAAGRPPIDVVLIFKVLFLQRYYGLGDHQIEYQITDRVSFRKFLGIRTLDDIPDEKTVWHYKNLLSQKGTFDKLFDEFRSFLDAMGLRFDEGSESTIRDMRRALAKDDIDTFMLIMKSFFAGYDYSVIGKESLEVHYQNVIFAVCKLIGLRVKAEYHTSNGRYRHAHLIETDQSVFLFEFKLNAPSKRAIRQIEAKDHAAQYAADKRKVYKIGVNFSSHIR